MQTWQVEHHGQVGQNHAISALHGKVHLTFLSANIDSANLGAFLQTISGHWPRQLIRNASNASVIRAQNGCAVERHAMQELHKGRFQFLKVVPVGFHVVGINVGNHRHHGQQVQEGCVRFIGLHHDVVTCAQFGIGACAVQSTANHKRGVQACFSQNAGHQAGGGGFAVGPCNGHALLHAHQFSQHDRTGHHWNMA